MLRERKHWLWVAAALSLAAGLLLGLIFHGDIVLGSLLFMSVLFVLMPDIVIAAIVRFIYRKQESPRKDAWLYGLRLVRIVIYMQLLAYPVGLFLWKQNVDDARNFCVSVVEKAETLRQDSGSYPQSLDELVGDSKTSPDLIRQNINRKHRVYEIIDGHPACSFIVTGGLFPEMHTYSGKTKRWEVRD